MATMAAFPQTGGYYDQQDSWSSEERSPRRAQRPSECVVRTFPNEDILFWQKAEIDNTRVVRKDNPEAVQACLKFIGASAAFVVVVVGLLLPNAYSLIGGIQLEQLRQKNASLREERRRLEVEESRLTSPERIERLAAQYNFIDPAPDSVLRLDGRSREAVAQMGSH